MSVRFAFMAALGLALSCGQMVRNSELGSTVDAGFFGGTDSQTGGDCNCRGGLCCGNLCCDLTETCCVSGNIYQCVRPDLTGTACAGP
jgi:hypothetical protein